MQRFVEAVGTAKLAAWEVQPQFTAQLSAENLRHFQNKALLS